MRQRHRISHTLGFWGRAFAGRRKCTCPSGLCISLSDLHEQDKAKITCNNDLKTIERGLYHGREVSVFRNESFEPNMIVAVGDARYVLDKRVAKLIMVRVL
jgi:Fe2+ transport system protein FeoA